jgi:hypothetical protein
MASRAAFFLLTVHLVSTVDVEGLVGAVPFVLNCYLTRKGREDMDGYLPYLVAITRPGKKAKAKARARSASRVDVNSK